MGISLPIVVPSLCILYPITLKKSHIPPLLTLMSLKVRFRNGHTCISPNSVTCPFRTTNETDFAKTDQAFFWYDNGEILLLYHFMFINKHESIQQQSLSNDTEVKICFSEMKLKWKFYLSRSGCSLGLIGTPYPRRDISCRRISLCKLDHRLLGERADHSIPG